MRVVLHQPPNLQPAMHAHRGLSLPLLRRALEVAGCDVAEVASDKDAAGVESPAAWCTLGLCPHAPDRLGPLLQRTRKVPYLVVEPQLGPGSSELAAAEDKQQTKEAVRSAAHVLSTSRETLHRLRGLLPDGDRLTHLPPFLELAGCFAAGNQRQASRALLRSRGGSTTSPCLVAAGPWETGAALENWRMLALAASRAVALDWRLIVLGQGPAAGEVQAVFRSLPAHRVRLVSVASPEERWSYLAAADIFCWPALHGVGLDGLLEAQATGTPVVACGADDVRQRVLEGHSGRLAAANAESLANGVSFLLRQRQFLASYAANSRDYAMEHHDVSVAARRIARILAAVVPSTSGDA